MAGTVSNPQLTERVHERGGVNAEAAKANAAALQRSVQNLNEVLQAGALGTRPGMTEAVIGVRNTLKSLLSQSGTGNLYKIGKRATKADKAAGRNYRSHRASAPGQPPAPLTGRLRQGYRGWVTTEAKQVVGWVGTAIKYAPGLEFGTKRTRPRPHLRVAIAQEVSRIGRHIAANIEREQRTTAKGLRAERLGK